MYSTRSNQSARKPFEFLQPPMVPQFGRPPEERSMGFGTLPNLPQAQPRVPEFMKTRWNPDQHPDQRRLIDLGYPVGGGRNPIVDSSDFPRQMEYALEDNWKLRDQVGGMGGNSGILNQYSNSANEGRTPIPQNMDLFDELSKPMIRQLPMSVLTGQGEMPVQPAQQSYTHQFPLSDGSQFKMTMRPQQPTIEQVPANDWFRQREQQLRTMHPELSPPPGYDFEAWNERRLLVPIEEADRQTAAIRAQYQGARQAQPLQPGNINLANRPVVKNPDGSISTVRSMSFNDGQSEVLIPTVSDDGRIMGDEEAIQYYRQSGKHLGRFATPEEATSYAEGLHNQQDQMYSPQANDPMADLSRQTAAIQGAPPMGATPGTIQPQQYGQQQRPYPGGMSGPQMQGSMQNMLLDMLSRQQMGRQYNDGQLRRDQYNDGWDRARADIFNPLMGGLLGGRSMAAMTADSNNRRNMINDRRDMRRQSQNDNWNQTKDLVSMIAANDPQTIKNQNALTKLQLDAEQKRINLMNAGTQQYGTYANAANKSRIAAVAEQNARTNESNMLRMLNEGSDRSQQGWARINQQAGQWQQSLEMRQAELEQRKAQAQQSGDHFAVQQSFREQQELNDEAYRYQKLQDDMRAKAEGLNPDGSPKVSDEFRKQYGIERPEPPAQTQPGPADWMKWISQNFGGRPQTQQPVSPAKTPPASGQRSPQFTRDQALAELERRRKARAGK